MPAHRRYLVIDEAKQVASAIVTFDHRGTTNEGETVLMRQTGPWLLAGMLVAIALVVAFIGSQPPAEPPGSVPAQSDDSRPTGRAEPGAAATSSPALTALDRAPRDHGARLLSDTEGARRNILRMSIRDAGHDCPDVRSAEPLEPGGGAWRVTCGGLRLYWIEIDEFGRMSVEPGAYDESDFDTGNGTGGRTLTIPQEELPDSR